MEEMTFTELKEEQLEKRKRVQLSTLQGTSRTFTTLLKV